LEDFTMPTRTPSLDAITDALAMLGYAAGPPGRQAEAIDREVCAEAECSACGQRGLGYHPFTRGRSYRAIAVCPACGQAEEF
jgi:hypothetical protein